MKRNICQRKSLRRKILCQNVNFGKILFNTSKPKK